MDLDRWGENMLDSMEIGLQKFLERLPEEVRADYSDERYRFVFNDRPSSEVIGLMKRHGFKWSPANKAWQRQITPNARYNVTCILDDLSKMSFE